jgi:hypothetical protein
VETAAKATADTLECIAGAQTSFLVSFRRPGGSLYLLQLLFDGAKTLLHLALELRKLSRRGGSLGINHHIDRHDQFPKTEANGFPHAPLKTISSDGPAQSTAYGQPHPRPVQRTAPLRFALQVEKRHSSGKMATSIAIHAIKISVL